MNDANVKSIVQQFAGRVEQMPDAVAFEVFLSGTRVPSAAITWQQWYDTSRAVAVRLMRAGVAHGDRVVVLSANAPMWPITDMALQMIGAVGVGIYPTSTAAQVAQVIEDSGATLAFVRGAGHWRTFSAARQLCSNPIPAVVDTVSDLAMRGDGIPDELPGDMRWEQWVEAGRRALVAPDAGAPALSERHAAVSLDDLAALIYTSGSSGEPKGACLSHRYLAASAASIGEVLPLTSADRTLSYLPFSHAAERVFGQCTRIAFGMTTALIEDPSDVFSVAVEFAPTLFGGLPRLFERLYEAAEVARRTGGDPAAAIAARLGSRCRYATSGGAAMPAPIADALKELGVTVLGAYGQTEHLCIAMNRPDHNRFDTVGPPMPGTSVQIAPDGELLVAASALTFSGYWNDAAATASAFSADRRWLHTGDRAELLDDGSLRITGRIKELIALSTGRKVAPLPIEAALTASPYIAHAVCYGEGKKYLTALVSLRQPVVEAWAHERGINGAWQLLAQHDDVRALVTNAVNDVNATVARTDRIQRVAITDHTFSVTSGELTPTSKIRRGEVTSRYAPILDALYVEPAK